MDKRTGTRKGRRSFSATSDKQVSTIGLREHISIDHVMNEFVDAKIAERAAARTIRDYQKHFLYLQSWLQKHHLGLSLKEVTPKILREYVSWMSNEKERYDDHPHRMKRGIVGLSPMTVNVRVRTMKAFFNWCQREGFIEKSPATDIKLQRVDEERILAFTEEQIVKLLKIPDRSSFTGFRDYVTMITLLDTGLRISELFSLKKDDVDMEQLILTVPWEKAKTRKKRVVPVSKKTGKLIAELILENEDFTSWQGYIFCTSFGHQMTLDAFDDRLKTYRKKAALEGARVSAHTFRHRGLAHPKKEVINYCANIMYAGPCHDRPQLSDRTVYDNNLGNKVDATVAGTLFIDEPPRLTINTHPNPR